MQGDPTAELHPDFSSPGATPTPWPEVDAALRRAEIFWISTVRADGRPHVTPLPAMWLERLAELWGSRLDWPSDVDEHGFRHRPDGRGPNVEAGSVPVLAVRPPKILSFGRGERFTQTRYRP